jgi:hypothetical protein
MDMIKFKAKIEMIGVNPFVFLPDSVLHEIFIQAGKNKGKIPVKIKIDGHEFTQTLIKWSGSWRLYLNTPMRKAAKKDVGDVSVTGVAGSDEDVLAFDPTSLGSFTRGTWSMGFDGSDVGLGDTADEDVDALDVTSNWTVYLSTAGNFAVPGVSGADEDVFACALTSTGTVTGCNYSSALYFDGSTWGLSANDVDAFNILSPGS